MKAKVAFLLVSLFFLFIGVWIIKQREYLTFKGSAKSSVAQIYLLPDQVSLKKGETVIFDVVIESSSSISAATVRLPFDKDSLKLTKYSFTASPLTLSLSPLTLTQANKEGQVVISRALNRRTVSRDVSRQFLLASLWFTLVNDDKRVLELTPDIFELTDISQDTLSPIEISGGVIQVLPSASQDTALQTPSPRPTVSLDTGAVLITAIEDSYISADSEATILGKEVILKISDDPESISYLKFDLRPLAKKPISLALLRLYNTERPVGTFRVTESPNSWHESRLTFINRPPLGKVITKNDDVVTSGWTDTDITDFVRSNTGKIVSLRLDSPDGADLVFNSKENSSNQPYILVQ